MKVEQIGWALRRLRGGNPTHGGGRVAAAAGGRSPQGAQRMYRGSPEVLGPWSLVLEYRRCGRYRTEARPLTRPLPRPLPRPAAFTPSLGSCDMS